MSNSDRQGPGGLVQETLQLPTHGNRHHVAGRLFGLGQRAIGPAIFLAVWHCLASSGTLPSQILPSPEEVFRAGADLWKSGELQEGIAVSFVRASTGLAIGTVLGTVFGLLAGIFRTAENVIDTPMQMARAVPILALVPLFILWFGIEEKSKILMVALATIFPIYLNLHAGIRGIDRRYFELAKTASLSHWQVIREVLLPGGFAGWLVGLRYSSGIAWLVLVVSEQVNATSGLGYLMMDARQSFRTDIVILGIVIYGILGILTDRLVRALEIYLLRWQNTGASA